ncbi:MAG: cardiolipin synthase [Desulfofustis sp.]|nr:cardiolipin synthase [Desulfofustis sp.]
MTGAQEYHELSSIIPTLILLADLTIRIGLSFRVIMRKRPHGITFAWLIIILLIPLIGALLYLLVGENRISDKRIARTRANQDHYQHWLNSLRERAPINWQEMAETCLPLHRQAETLIGIPAMTGNSLQLFEATDQTFESIISDIAQARSTCHLQFYIWQQGGKVTAVEEALLEATRRGVICRVLVDSIGSRDFLKGPRCRQLREAGIRIRESLPAGLIKALFARIDIRNHRKIVVIDGEIAYSGSTNMVDPRYFKQDSGVGQWVDIMVRITGPVVESLAGTFISDWFLEASGQQLDITDLTAGKPASSNRTDVHRVKPTGNTAIQLVPSGPGLVPEAIHSLLLTTIYSARHELVLTTPYFVPDEPLLTALKSAAQRGVTVIIILPQRNDSRLVHYASHAHFQELTESGVQISLFHGGLLHAKTITVDRQFALFGSVNLDMRSFWLNFETTLFIYDRDFSMTIRRIQERYEQLSTKIDRTELAQRPVIKRFKENVALLIGPLL